MQRPFPTSLVLSIAFLAAILGVARARGRQESAPAPAPEQPALPIEGISAPPPAAKIPPPLPAGPAPDLDLVFTSQVAGWIEPCG